MTTREVLYSLWDLTKTFFEIVWYLITSMYETFGIWFIIWGIIISFICYVCVFGGLIDDYDEYRKQKNMKNLDDINRKLR